MTSPGLKRTLDLEIAPHQGGASGLSSNGPVANGTKRRCVGYAQHPRMDPNGLYMNNSPFRDSSLVLNSLNDDIASFIQDEIQAAMDTAFDTNSKDYEPLALTVRQAQSICEKLIKDREQKLREEYDRILACKLAEQYDQISKANYINTYIEPFIPRPTRPSISQNNPLAAGVVAMLRSSAGGLTTPQNDLTALAATLSANGLTGASSNPHLAYNIQQQAAAAGLQAQQQRVISGPTSAINMGPVLLTSNLDEQLAIPEALFTLFGVFGDVIRVKILFNKKDNALIQMADTNQAQVAQGYLDKQKIFGKVIRVTRSKHQLVQMPRDGNQSDAGLTKDFTNSPLHRFKIPGSRNCLNIYPPSNTLHISNIPATIEESDINRAFKEACKFEFTSFKFFPKDRKMALIKFDSIEQATIALIKMHNYPISEENNLRVSFSKSIMQQ